MIKEGYDHFEVTRQEPKVDVCEKRYVFDAAAPNGPASSLKFSPPPSARPTRCRRRSSPRSARSSSATSAQVAQLISRGTPDRAGAHRHRRRHEPGLHRGGHRAWRHRDPHRVEVAAGLDPRQYQAAARPRGRDHDRQHHEPGFGRSGELLQRPVLVTLRTRPTRRRPAPSAKAVAAKPTQTASVAAVRPKAQSQPSAPAQSPGQAPAQTEVKSAANAGAAKPPAPQQPADASQPPVATASNTTTLLRGAQAAVPAGSFDSRWSAMH